MPTIDTVLLTVPYTGDHRRRLVDALDSAELIWSEQADDERIASALEVVDVAILGSDLDTRFLGKPQLRWVHCDHAGLEKSAVPELFDTGLAVTSSAGRSAPALADHVIFFMLALAYEYPRFLDAQRKHQWGIENQNALRGVNGRTVGILGVGNNGSEVAVRAHALGMRVQAYDIRSPEGDLPIDVMYTDAAGLDVLLAESDFLVVTLPLSDNTYHMIGERELALMKLGSYLVNIGRGSVVDEGALVRALQNGQLAGAGLDTFEIEPLPADSVLWDLPNVLITPHVTPQVPDRTARSLDIICDNIERYRSGQPLRNALAPTDVYTGGVRS